MSTDTDGVVTFEELLVDVKRGLETAGLSLDTLDAAVERKSAETIALATGRNAADVERVFHAFRVARELRPVPRRRRDAGGANPGSDASPDMVRLAGVTYAALERFGVGGAPELARLDAAALRSGIDAALADGTIPRAHATAVDGLLESLDRKRIDAFLAPTVRAEAHPAAVVLGVLAPSKTVQTAVAELALQFGADAAGFWSAVDSDKRIAKAVRRALRTSTEFLELSGGNVSLLETLAADNGSGAALDPARLAMLDDKAWLKLLGVSANGTTPDDPAAAATLAGARQYARTLAAAVERRYPGEKLAAELARDKRRTAPLVEAREDIVTFLANNPDFHLVDTPLAGFLTGDPKQDAARLKDLGDGPRAIELLASYQRLHRLLPPLVDIATTVVRPGEILVDSDARYDIASRLVNDGFTSALSIAALPLTDFVRRYADLPGGEPMLEVIHARAMRVTDASLHLAINIRNWAHPSLPRALPRAVKWGDTFGAVASCGCGECRSIHSPAAYLFDCLHFLEDAGVPGVGTSPLAALKSRRPDLLQIALTCENTGTRIPYIDLVNELLEQLVAPEWFRPFALPAGAEAALNARTVTVPLRDAFRNSANAIDLSSTAEVHPLGARAWHLIDRATMYVIRKNGAALSVESACFQTEGSEDELRAAPQHTIPAAYRKLELKVYPWSMPFSLAWTEIVEYLARLDVRTSDVLEAFSPPSTPTSARTAPFEARDAVAGAYLGLSPVEFQIIAGQKLAGDGPITIGAPNDYPQDFWGYDRAQVITFREWDGSQVLGSWTDAVWRVPEFLRRSGLSYVGLLELLGAYFINPAAATTTGRMLSIVSRDPNDPASCDVAKLAIQGVPANEAAARATKVHRFLRLQRRLGWSVADLDRVLAALGVATIDRDAVVAISLVERLRRRTGLSLAEIAGWMGDIDHAAYTDVQDDDAPRLPSFYDEMFRIPDAADPGSPFASDVGQLATTIGQHKVRLAARLGINEVELDRLRADARVLIAADRDALTLATLSSLSRYASLARWSGLGVDEILRAADIFGSAPFASAAAAGGGAAAVTAIDRANIPLRFVEALDTLAEASLSPASAAYLFVDDGRATAAPALDDAAITGAVRGLVAAAQPILAELAYAADASGALVASELVKCGWSDAAARRAGSFFADRQVYTVSLATTDLPDALFLNPGRLRYDEPSVTLSATGVLASTERDALLQLPNATAAFQTAIRTLFDAPRDFARAELGYVVPPEYAVPLTRMPRNLRLPKALEVALVLDADRRMLVFRGDRRLLAGVEYPPAPLDADWTAFRAAVETLRTTPLPATVTQEPPLAENRFFASDVELEGVVDSGKTADQRCAYALERVARGRWRIESERVLVGALSGVTGLDATALRAARPVWASLVFDPATAGPSELVRTQTAFTSSPSSPVAAAVRRLHKIGELAKGLALPASAVLWLLRNAARIGGPDLLQLPARLNDAPVAWDRVVPLIDFARAYRGFLSAEGSLLDLLDLVLAGPLVVHADWWKLVARIKGWEGEQVQVVTGSPAFPAGFDRPQFYRRLLVKMRLAERCGVSVGALMDWSIMLAWSAGGLWGGNRLADVAAEVKSGVRRKVGRERWLTIATEVNGPLRERRRDALLAYVLARPNPWDNRLLRDADELFDYLLIDPKMASCMLTSRLRQATSSVQTFVQRALMGLEPAVGIAADRAAEWNTWRRQYRVWEANRKVFLYPENWLEPELRDDKSPLFRQVESRLLQAALTPDRASKAIVDYVDGLSGLSDLEIVGAYHQAELVDGVEVNAIHLVGRTHALPRQYFYRRADHAGDMATARWTPWAKLDLEIESDYILPFAMGRDAYLFWPIIAPAVPKTTAADSTPPKQWEIKLGWSRSKGAGPNWSPKQVGRDSLVFSNDQNLDPRDAFFFLVQPALEGATVLCSGVRSVTTGAVDPNTLRTRVTESAALVNSAVAIGDFVIWPTVSDNLGRAIPNATVTITETSPAIIAGYSAASIVPLPGSNVRSYTYRTGADGRIVGGAIPMLLSWSKKWAVTVSLPGGSAAEFASTMSTYVLETPSARSDKWRQEIVLAFIFSRKPVIVTSKQLGSFGCFSIERSGKVVAQSWPWAGAPTWLPPRNTTWSENAYVEAAGSDDRVYLPELTGATVMARTPGTFRLRPLGQIESDIPSLYYFDGAGKRYQISFATVSGTRTPVLAPTFHPFVAAYAMTLGVSGERALLRRDQQQLTDGGATFRSVFFDNATSPTIGANAMPVEAVSFDAASFFGSYNWELFFHLPLTIAGQLTRNQRFADAQQWLHYIYDPTSVEANALTPQYCWKFKPFFDAPPGRLADLFATPSALAEQLRVLREDPFNPYAIARLRTVAFMKNVVMKYLDNLIAWGDQLFARDSMESLNEATQLYLLAHQIIGPRPPKVPSRARPAVQSYASLAELARGQAPALSDLGAIAVAVSSFIPPSGPAAQNGNGGNGTGTSAVSGAPLGTMMYFCLPANDKLTSYWDTVEDRLFKLRHCLDVKGRFRIPALFEPPIDPALLVRARAAGVDISDVLAEATAPLPNYRFAILSQKATELASELKALGSSLLGALEKRDGETLVLLRERHEQSLFPLVEDVRQQQIAEADAQLDTLRRSKETAVERWRYYLRLLGKTAPSTADAATTLRYLPMAAGTGGGSDTAGLSLNQHETQQLDWLDAANNFTIVGGIMNTLSGVLHALPDSVYPVKWGGSHAGSAAEAIGSFFKLLSDNAAYQAGRAALVGGYARRQDEWTLQHNTAVGELRQLERQIVAAEIRKAVAERELETHRQQVENAKEAETFLKTKFTNEQLYDWFVGQLSTLYFQGYRLAHAVVKRAERAYRYELGREDSDFIQFGYWDDLKKGLLAGERLAQDLKRMEVAYLDEHAREYEITKHVSLASLDPSALIQLKATGACEITVPEWAFDLDYPGHYMRRLKNVSVTIPCVVGPYAGVNCTLTLLSSSIRTSASATAPYARKQQQGVPQDDARFADRFSGVQSIVTSSGQNDTGMFEVNLRDDRYLPFEGHGAIGRWRIELPLASNSIDVNTVSDVILHVRYTAREGGSGLAGAARETLKTILKPTAGASLFRLFSVRQEFPDQWYRFLNGGAGATAKLGPLDVGRRRFPLLFTGKKLAVLKERDYYLVDKNGITPLELVMTGGSEVELQAPDAAQRMTIDQRTHRIGLEVDRANADLLPVDVLVVCRYRAED